jgi:hypothetical protein
MHTLTPNPNSEPAQSQQRRPLLAGLRRLADGKGDFGVVGANKRLNSRARIVEYRQKWAVVKTYSILRSGPLRQNSDIMQSRPRITVSTTSTNAPVVKTFWPNLLNYHGVETQDGSNRRSSVRAASRRLPRCRLAPLVHRSANAARPLRGSHPDGRETSESLGRCCRGGHDEIPTIAG